MKILIGILAGTLTVITFIPQTIKVVMTKETDDLSLITFLFLATEVILWAIYGFLDKSKIILITNIFVLIMALIIISYIL